MSIPCKLCGGTSDLHFSNCILHPDNPSTKPATQSDNKQDELWGEVTLLISGFDPSEDSLEVLINHIKSKFTLTHEQSDLDLINKILPADFHSNVSIPGRVATLWQYYEAEVNKYKSQYERVKELESVILWALDNQQSTQAFAALRKVVTKL